MYAVTKLYPYKQYVSIMNHEIKNCKYYAVMLILSNIIEVECVPSEPFGTPDMYVPLIRYTKMEAQKVADRLNGKAMEFPTGHMLALKAAFKTAESTFYPGYHYVTDKTSKYLCDRFGLGTDWVEHNIMDTYKVAFDWRLQKWMVSA